MTFLSRFGAASSWKAGAPRLTANYVPWAKDIPGYSIFPNPQSAVSPITYSITSGALPDGLSLDTSTGEVYGTPTATGTFSFTLHLLDDRGFTADFPASIEIGEFWTPANLASAAKFWYDHSSAVTDVSGAASQWNDLSASAIHVTQGTGANRPTINSSDSAVGGLRTLSFDGSNDRLGNDSSTAKALYKNVATGWIFTVVSPETGIGANSLAVYAPNNSGPTRASVGLSNASSQAVFATSGRRADSDSTASVSSPDQYSLDTFAMIMGLLNYAGRSAELYVNGTQKGSATGLWSAGSATSNTNAASVALTLGSNNIGSGSFAKMRMAAALGGSGASLPTSTERAKLFGWAAFTYGLRSLLPNDHPYKSQPPIQ